MICECWPLEPRLPVETYEAAAAARPTDNGPLQIRPVVVVLGGGSEGAEGSGSKY